MKKLGILVLAMALVFGMSAGVMAAEETNDQQIKAQVTATSYLQVDSIDFGADPEVSVDSSFKIAGNISGEDNIYLSVADTSSDITVEGAMDVAITIVADELVGDSEVILLDSTTDPTTNDVAQISETGEVTDVTGTATLNSLTDDAGEYTTTITYTLADTE